MQYTTLLTNSRLWIRAGDRLLGGYAANALRSYVFPLYTPAGVLVVQEAPADHPHQQGIHVGLSVDGHDLWNAGSFDKARHQQRMGTPLKELVPQVDEQGVTLLHTVAWTSIDGDALLHEDRSVRFRLAESVTHVHWRSHFHAVDRPVRIDQTKEAGIGVRVPPHWESYFGGRIRDARGGVGEAACFDGDSPWLNVEGSAGNGATAGVVIAAASAPCPWFTRDYGEHIYNPSRHSAVELKAGESVTWAVDVIAYDGARTVGEIEKMR
ncbi:MAG: DUF6807 family protein [Caldilineaceae bacterium]|nr:PmoA family protein [Caldilineaceae bacterium]